MSQGRRGRSKGASERRRAKDGWSNALERRSDLRERLSEGCGRGGECEEGLRRRRGREGERKEVWGGRAGGRAGGREGGRGLLRGVPETSIISLQVATTGKSINPTAGTIETDAWRLASAMVSTI